MTRLAGFLRAFCLTLLLVVSTASAQDVEPINYDEWTSLATRAEEVVEAGRASDAALEELRTGIAVWRDRFLAGQGENAARIATLQSQFDALGAPPEEGSEPPEIAERRAELTQQLDRLRAPVRRAEEAYTRSDGIIREIDTIIRERQAQALLELGPSPLNPANWAAAWNEARASLWRTWDELRTNLASPVQRAEARANLPLILGLLILAAVLLMRGHRWVKDFVERLRRGTMRGTGLWSLVLSLGQILVPLAGIYALTVAMSSTGFAGPRMDLFLDRLPVWAAVLLGIRWLADQSFHPSDDVATMPLDGADRREAKAYANILAVLYVAKSVLDTLTAFDSYSPASEAVVDYPLLVLTGLFLFRLGRVRNTAAIAGSDEAAAAPDASLFRLRMARIFGRAAMIVGVVGPVLGAFGYFRVGEFLVYPAIETLALVGLVLVLQRAVTDLYHLVTGRDPRLADSLWPVLAGFAIVLMSLPVLALVWGARVADLTELWTRFREGFVFGETRISPTDFLAVIVVFAIGLMLTRLLQGGLRSAVLPKTGIDPGGQNAIVAGIGYLGIFLAAIIAITAGGLDLSSLAIVAGALSVGIGFGLQNIVSNFVSGIILLIERPISEGDWIEVGGQHGIVKDISVRSTRIETFDKFDLIVPNADLVSGVVRNYTKGNSLGRIIVPVGVAYGTDTRKVEKLLYDIAKHHDDVMLTPAPFVYFAGFGADSLDFEIRAVLYDVSKGLAVRTEMRHQIAATFKREGIEIPFAQRDVWLRNPETLRATAQDETDRGAAPTGEDT